MYTRQVPLARVGEYRVGPTKLRFALVVLALTLAVPSVAVAISPFIDVTPGRFYENPINWAATNNITTGSPAGSNTFKPDNPVTRGEVVTFLKRYNDNITQPDITAVDSRVTTVDQHVTDLGQTVGTLGCATNQVAHYNGTTWVCGTPTINWSLTPASATTADTGGAANVGRYTSIAIGTDGNPIVSYVNSTSLDLEVVHCTNHLCTTRDAPVVLDTGAPSGAIDDATSMAIGTDGFPVIGYHDVNSGDVKVVHCTVAACATHDTPNVVISGSGTIFNGAPSLAIGADGLPVLSFAGTTSGFPGSTELVVAHCNDKPCAASATINSAHPAGLGDHVGLYSSIAIASDGNPIISYYDSTNKDLLAVHCSTVACGFVPSPHLPVTLDSTGDVGRFTSIAVGTDGNPIVSYTDFTNLRVKAVHCSDSGCTAHDPPTVLDDPGATGGDVSSSIAIGDDGVPIIAFQYLDPGPPVAAGHLRVAECADAACSAPPLITTADNGAGAILGGDSSTAIGADGNPVIAYYDSTNGDLKVATLSMQPTNITYD